MIKLFADHFKNAVKEHPSKIAIDYKGKQTSYKELDEISSCLAIKLSGKYRIIDGSVIGIFMAKSDSYIVLILALIKAGITYLPIDPSYPKGRIDKMISIGRIDFLITDRKNQDLVTVDSLKRVLLEELISTDNEKFIVADLPFKVNPDNIIYIVFTSGTTGSPKGIKTKHSNVSYYLNWCINHFDSSRFESSICASTISFDLFTLEVFYPLCIGKKIILVETPQLLGLYFKRIKEKCMACSVPSVLEEILKSNISLTCVSDLVLTGERASKNLLKSLISKNDEMNVWNLYGPTETTVTCTFLKINSPDDNGSIGKPIKGTTILILDENGIEQPINSKGEIFIGGGGVSSGYLNSSETIERFIYFKHHNNRYYRTGDIGSVDENGNIHLHGRKDDQIKINGIRIELLEIEELLNSHQLIEKSVVLKMDKTSTLNDLVGFVFTQHKLTETEVISYLKERIPSAVIPKRWVFKSNVSISKNGKVDKAELISTINAEHNEQ